MSLSATPVTMNELKHANNRSPTPDFNLLNAHHLPKTQRSVTTQEQSQHSGVYLHFTFLRLLKHSQVCFMHPFPAEVGGGRRDSTFV